MFSNSSKLQHHYTLIAKLNNSLSNKHVNIVKTATDKSESKAFYNWKQHSKSKFEKLKKSNRDDPNITYQNNHWPERRLSNYYIRKMAFFTVKKDKFFRKMERCIFPTCNKDDLFQIRNQKLESLKERWKVHLSKVNKTCNNYDILHLFS